MDKGTELEYLDSKICKNSAVTTKMVFMKEYTYRSMEQQQKIVQK